jgi:hypothetical protein
MQGFLWAELNGVLVAGSSTVPAGVAPLQTGNTPTDIYNFVVSNLTAMTGDAPVAWSYGGGIAFLGWGANAQPYGNTFKTRPFVAIASRFDYNYGTLAIPTRTIDPPDILKWFIRIEATSGDSAEISPAWVDIEAYRAAHAGANPVLIAMELNPE